MRYVSTRGDAPILGFEDALLEGLARDGGLYLPQEWPQLKPAEIADFAGRPYHEVAADVVWPFVGDAFPRQTFDEMVREAYATFGHDAVTPLVQIAPNSYVLELFHGPTLAFKDVAMQLLARMMNFVLEKRNGRATIVGATSGDTGGAAIEAFRGLSRVDVFILYPAGRVSDVQRRMMTTPTDDNIHALEVDGTFDDCQALLKALFRDEAFRDRVRLSGVNSINWARIVPQIAYYFYAAANLGAPYRPVSFAVPTGNFGDVFAGYAARRMGLGIDQLTIASNSNDILPRTVSSGVYEKRGVVSTMSPSMDIQVSSNFERLLFEIQGRDAALVRSQMASLAQSGQFEVKGGAAALADEFQASAATEDDAAACIRRVKTATGYVVEPHTACGVVAAERLLSHRNAPAVILATAHAAKFPEAMAEVLGQHIELPARLAGLMSDRERAVAVKNDINDVQRVVEGHLNAVDEVM